MKERVISIIEKVAQSLLTPWPWVFLGVAFLSPYGVEILKLILQTVGGK